MNFLTHHTSLTYAIWLVIYTYWHNKKKEKNNSTPRRRIYAAQRVQLAANLVYFQWCALFDITLNIAHVRISRISLLSSHSLNVCETLFVNFYSYSGQRIELWRSIFYSLSSVICQFIWFIVYREYDIFLPWSKYTLILNIVIACDEKQDLYTLATAYVAHLLDTRMCVCLCVCERERERS